MTQTSNPKQTPPSKGTPSQHGKKLLDQYRDQIRLKQYSPRTEKTYIQWVRDYILFHEKRHPREMGVPEINKFITHLVVERKASASTHTAPAVGAGETRRSAPYSSYIATPSRSNSTRTPSPSSDPKKENEYLTSCHRAKLVPSSPT